MFREMRRNKQQLSFEECEEILKKSTAGVLAVSGDDGYPYAVPLSYVYCDNKIYFHSAKVVTK
jgi:nitroimidazol reductase NimA-like FMN-containing flavoprotein (pyridoxamine 5'-phosphate oxidase superfamily)